MKFAVVAQSPTFGGKLVAVDEAKAKAVPGVTQVVRLTMPLQSSRLTPGPPSRAWPPQARSGMPGPNAKLSTADIVAQLTAAMEKPGAVARHDGDPDGCHRARRAEGRRGIRAAVSRARDHGADELHRAHDQGRLRHLGRDADSRQITGRRSEAHGLKPEQIRIHNHLLGGGFGRRLEYDGIVRAVQIAQQVSGPVQVIWTREEDIQHDMYRPYYYDRMSAGLDAQGKPVGWSHRIAGSSIIARYFPAALKNGVDGDAVECSRDPAYDLGAIHVDWIAQEPPDIPTAFWRGVGPTRSTFVVESFIDELASTTKQDPLAYRLALLDKAPRAAAVLRLAAERSGWGKPLPAGQGRGIALCTGFGSFIAQVVQLSVDRMAPSIPRTCGAWSTAGSS
jgi:isoquinoline 1-oxidoreductase beta subunit